MGLLIPAVAVVVACMALHQAGALTSVLGAPVRPVAGISSAAVLTVQLALAAVVFVLPPYGFGGSATWNLPFGRWLVLLPLSLSAIIVQCAAEEIVFRGYLQQQLAARFRHPAIWIGLPSVLFALGHYMPESAGSNAG